MTSRAATAHRRTILVVGTVALVVMVALPLGAGPVGASLAPAAAPWAPIEAWPRDAARHEAAFVAAINQLRASRGLPELKVNAHLMRKARGWATAMAAAGRIRHSRLSVGISGNWQKLGENVGMGASESHLHAAFVDSGTHLANLVDPAFRYVGVGVVVSRELIFVSQVFMQRSSVADRRTNRVPPGRTAQRVIPLHPIERHRTLPPSNSKAGLLFRPIS